MWTLSNVGRHGSVLTPQFCNDSLPSPRGDLSEKHPRLQIEVVRRIPGFQGNRSDRVGLGNKNFFSLISCEQGGDRA
jgi:hypothetical protein